VITGRIHGAAWRAARASIVAAACALPAACTHHRPPTTDATASDSASVAPVWLTVQNHHRANVVLYAVRGTLRQRLGTVTAAATQRFALPPNTVADAGGFVLVGEPLGGDAPARTEVLHVFPGQRVVWTLESRLAQSTVAVY